MAERLEYNFLGGKTSMSIYDDSILHLDEDGDGDDSGDEDSWEEDEEEEESDEEDFGSDDE
ncbi:MAG: hypothetical protein AABY11_02480 [archaeon]